MSEIFHCNPIDIHEEDCCHKTARNQTAIILIVFDLVQYTIPSIWHKSFADDKGVDTNGKDKHGSYYKKDSEYSINSI